MFKIKKKRFCYSLDFITVSGVTVIGITYSFDWSIFEALICTFLAQLMEKSTFFGLIMLNGHL